MVGRPASLKYLAMASSKIMEQGSRGARLETSACVCTSMATSLARSSLGTYFDIEDLLAAAAERGPDLMLSFRNFRGMRNIRDPGPLRKCLDCGPGFVAHATLAQGPHAEAWDHKLNPHAANSAGSANRGSA